MITLNLSNGTTQRVNLENRENEKPLRDAWYSMSDMVSCRNKELLIITDDQKTFTYKVSDIKNCIYSDMVWAGITGAEDPKPKTQKEPEKKKAAPDNAPKSVLSDTIDPLEIVNNMQGFFETALKVLKTMPDSQKRNMVLFIDGIREKSIPLDILDSALFEIASMAVRDSTMKIQYYVDMYCDHWVKNH